MQDDLLQHRPGLITGQFRNLRTIGGTRIRKRRAKHEAVESGVFEAKTNISSTDRGEERFRLNEANHRATQAVTQSFESYRGGGREKIQLLGEMVVGRVGTDTGAACHLSEREGPVLLLGDQFQRRLDQSSTEVAVMIGLGFVGLNFFRHGGPGMLTVSTCLIYASYT